MLDCVSFKLYFLFDLIMIKIGHFKLSISSFDFQGEWILSKGDDCTNSKIYQLYMYSVKCVNIGSSKDPFLIQVSSFAILFGNELDAEVYQHSLHFSSIQFTKYFYLMLVVTRCYRCQWISLSLEP